MTGQHTPVNVLYVSVCLFVLITSQDNTRYAFLQMDDRVLVYRGADQPDMSVINPESDVWQHIKVCVVLSLMVVTSCSTRYPSVILQITGPFAMHLSAMMDALLR